jgi:hypothetical protein
MKSRLLPIPVLLFLLLFILACKKKASYPVQPILQFKDFRAMNDSGVISVNFTDGDGDIGLYDSEVNSPYDFNSGNYYNFNIAYFEKDDQLGWVPGTDLNGDSIVFQYRIKPFTDLKKSTPLKGIIQTTIEPSYYNPLSAQSDTIMFKIQLVDRALNKSAWAESNEIIRN